uniref:Uncharacterized protein n=1 Tax=Rhizophora mucronata TaxID=61149 RepID=A0A2P2QEM4_RHIMU
MIFQKIIIFSLSLTWRGPFPHLIE